VFQSISSKFAVSIYVMWPARYWRMPIVANVAA